MKGINLNDFALLEFLKKNDNISFLEIVERIKKSRNYIFFHPCDMTVRRSLIRLEKEGKLNWKRGTGNKKGEVSLI